MLFHYYCFIFASNIYELEFYTVKKVCLKTKVCLWKRRGKERSRGEGRGGDERRGMEGRGGDEGREALVLVTSSTAQTVKG